MTKFKKKNLSDITLKGNLQYLIKSTSSHFLNMMDMITVYELGAGYNLLSCIITNHRGKMPIPKA